MPVNFPYMIESAQMLALHLEASVLRVIHEAADAIRRVHYTDHTKACYPDN